MLPFQQVFMLSQGFWIRIAFKPVTEFHFFSNLASFFQIINRELFGFFYFKHLITHNHRFFFLLFTLFGFFRLIVIIQTGMGELNEIKIKLKLPLKIFQFFCIFLIVGVQFQGFGEARCEHCLLISGDLLKSKLNSSDGIFDSLFNQIRHVENIIEDTDVKRVKISPYQKLNIKQMKIQVWVLCLVLLVSGQEESEGERRLRKLRQKASKNIINFSPEDFKEYAMQYPRPYDLVIYFTASSCKLCDQLKPEYEYMAELYGRAGYTGNVKNPVFFVTMNFNRETSSIFEMFGFTSAPNLVVSKPEMAIISEMEKKQYLQKFKWAITYSDGDVTTHKMLDFANQRTGKDVPYKPTIKAMLTMFFGFIFVTAIAALIYLKLKFIWTHWLVWFVGVLAIYITCVSGVVYDIIHNVPFVGRDKDTGEVVVFTGGTREQYGAEGLVVSLTISFIGLLFVSIIVAVDKVQNQMQVRIWSLIALAIILYLVSSLESVYKSKSWYGPSIYPPGDYVTGPIARDQGNNI